MKKNLFHCLLLAAFIIAAVSCSNKKEEQSSPASITNINGVDVVSVYGTWEEMGEQYGNLVAGHLWNVHNMLLEIIGDDDVKRDSIIAMSQRLYSRYPYRFIRFFEGMEKTSGLTIDQLVMNNAVEYVEGFFCSAMAAWGDYASGDLVYGRNYDVVSDEYAMISKDIIITVFHPSDGSLATAIIGYAGEIYAVNAINEKGLFVELNNGMPSAGWEINFERFASTTSLLEMMFDADDIDYIDAFFKSNLSFASFIIGVADKNEARSYEFCADGVEIATDANPEGLMVQTNHYVSENWQFPTPVDEESWMSITRRSNLLALAECNKGQINETKMREIIATHINDGGAMQDYTRYQFVYTPKTMKLHLRIKQNVDWTEVKISDFF